MLKHIAIASALVGSLALPAMANENPAYRQHDRGLQLQVAPQRNLSDVVAVETGRPAAAVIATDALYGGLAGAAIGAGVALINGNNYGRDIAIGAGVGLLAGGVVGAVDVAGRPDTVMHSEGTPVMKSQVSYGGSF